MNKFLLALCLATITLPVSAAGMPRKQTCIGIPTTDEYGTLRLKHPEPNGQYSKLSELWCDVADFDEDQAARVKAVCHDGNKCRVSGVVHGHGAFIWLKIYSVKEFKP